MTYATAPPPALDADLLREVDLWTDGWLAGGAQTGQFDDRAYADKRAVLEDLWGADAGIALDNVIADKLRRSLSRLASAGVMWASQVGIDPESLAPNTQDTTGSRTTFIDWSTFWDRDAHEAEWVYPDVLARGRGHAVYASHKTGKSLIMLNISADLATGTDPVVVTYLDYEMTEGDVRERLEEMGYGPSTDFSRFRYALLPTLPPLDTAAGAAELMAMVDGVQSEFSAHDHVVVIDTISRAVCGEENSADTFRDFYSHTGIQLKRRGITWARLDHAGKDKGQGQRGSSSKGDDVDVVWKLTATENGLRLHRDVARMSWVLPNVTFGQFDDPLRYVRLSTDWPAGTAEVANILDRLEVPLDASSRTASAALKTIDEGRRRQVVVAAMRWRIERLKAAS